MSSARPPSSSRPGGDAAGDTASRPSLMAVSIDDPLDLRAWSGTTHNMIAALREHLSEVHPVGPVRSKWTWPLFKLNALSHHLLGIETLPHFNPLVTRDYSRVVNRAVDEIRPDILFAPTGAILISRVPAGTPVIYATDATVQLLFDYNRSFLNVTARARAWAERLERVAIRRADVLLYPSRWAAASAVEHFGADPAKILVAPYGANLREPPDAESASRMIEARAARDSASLLLVGNNWTHKGCDIAVETLRLLRARGVNATLTIAGCAPPRPLTAEGLTIIPFLAKDDPLELARFERLFAEADLMLFPTRNDCFGIVLCEAAAYGLPVVASATGGVPEVVRDGVTGSLIAPEEGAAAYADAVASLIGQPELRREMARRGRRLFETEYNWRAWGERNWRFIEERIFGRAGA